MASAFPIGRFPADTTPPSHFLQGSLAADLSSFSHQAVSLSLFTEPLLVASPIISAVPIHHPPILPVATVAAI